MPLKKRERFSECFLRHLSFWVIGVKSPLIFYIKKKKKTKYKKMTKLFPFIDLIKKYAKYIYIYTHTQTRTTISAKETKNVQYIYTLP